jgi:predicted component of type VI protein secretion system
MIRLVVSRESGDHAIYEFNQDEVLIGRVPPADVVLDNESVSRRHVRLSKRPDAWRISDLGAPNGVFVQRKGMPPAVRVIVEEIESGDVICIERYRITFTVGVGETSTPGRVVGEAPEFQERSDAFTRVTTLPGLLKPDLTKALEARVPHDPDKRLQASLSLASGAPVQQLARENTTLPPAAGLPTLELLEAGKPSRTLSLGQAPIQFGSDPTCDVRMAGLTVPRFVATVTQEGKKVILKRLSSGFLGPKVVLAGETVKDTAELEDGDKFFVGAMAAVFRLPKGRA